jgi:hypothetical protein
MGPTRKRGPIGIVKMKKVSVHQFVPFVCERCQGETFVSIKKVGHRLMRGKPYKRTIPCSCGGVMKRSRFRIMTAEKG